MHLRSIRRRYTCCAILNPIRNDRCDRCKDLLFKAVRIFCLNK